MPHLAEELAGWAPGFEPGTADLALVERRLKDTLSVALAARSHPMATLAAGLPDAARWAAVGHVLDFDDLHLPSTTHISVVCAPVVLATGGDARAYLAAAGVMARLGTALGWNHYAAGWHATCTAGAPAAIGAGPALGLDGDGLTRALCLALPAGGGLQWAFGTDTKSLTALAALLREPGPEAVPGGLAVKIFPCCYAMRRPIGAVRRLLTEGAPDPEGIASVTVHTPEAAVHPLIHHEPTTVLQGKFSLEYAAALLDGHPGFASFTDDNVRRAQAQRLTRLVRTETHAGGSGLLVGETTVTVAPADGTERRAALAVPPGAPELPPTGDEFAAKLADCGADVPALLDGIDWPGAAALLRETLPGCRSDDRLKGAPRRGEALSTGAGRPAKTT
ncbi:MmgE/PrpD family protein [Streptomyces sp. NPDC005435]|uniref:MmgE/PrpD family protein n=1 Tax=Streptomyces sp. NPDC005435 TaxID=3154464 RepID=UPI0034532238